MSHRHDGSLLRTLDTLSGDDAATVIGPATTRLRQRRHESGRRHHRAGKTRRAFFERLEDRRLLAGLVFDSVILAHSETGAVYPSGMAVDEAGNTYMGGAFSGTVDFDRTAVHPGNSDILVARGRGDGFVAKYGPNNQLIWARRIGGDATASITQDRIGDIETDSGGAVYISGRFSESADFGSITLNSQGLGDAFVAKLDSNGAFMWANSWGSTIDEVSSSIAIDSNARVTAVAHTPGVTPTQLSIRQFDGAGNINWVRDQFSVSEVVRFDSLDTDAAGDIILSGAFNGAFDLDPGPGEQVVNGANSGSLFLLKNAFVSKLSSSGDFQWSTQYVADNVDSSVSSSIAIDDDGSVITVGRHLGQVSIVSTAASSLTFPDTAFSRVYFTRIDSSGHVTTLSSNGWSTRNGPPQIAATPNGMVAILGIYDDQLTLSPNVSLQAEPERGSGLALVELTKSFDVVSAVSVSNLFFPAGLASDAQGNVYLNSWVTTSVDYDPNPNVRYFVSNPDGSADASIVKFRPISNAPSTKFYVVNDASSDRTYEYDANGAAIENYSLNSGNSSPRGAASTAAGTTVWVADKNRKVYVYDTGGSLLGSWTAGTLSSKAQVEGLATNGTDVWIVDNNSDKVYRYTNAAGRLSASQTAASSFSLNSGNRNPKGIVTDGTYLWVVNDSSSDKVFKYTLSGSLVGSWTIDSGNKIPTGLTIDPANGSQAIWIVDSGTDRVYEYANGRAKTSGSLAASATFNLAAGNSNPQGIADPPPPVAVLSSTLVTASPRSSVAASAGRMAEQAFAKFSQFRAGQESHELDRKQGHARRVDELMSQLGNTSTTAGATAESAAAVADRIAHRSARVTGRSLGLANNDFEQSLELIAEELAMRD